MQLRLLVHSQLCGSILGKAGATIKSFAEDSRAQITVSPQDRIPRGATDRIVRIAGGSRSWLRHPSGQKNCSHASDVGRVGWGCWILQSSLPAYRFDKDTPLTTQLQRLKNHFCDRPLRLKNRCCIRCLIVSNIPFQTCWGGRQQTLWRGPGRCDCWGRVHSLWRLQLSMIETSFCPTWSPPPLECGAALPGRAAAAHSPGLPRLTSLPLIAGLHACSGCRQTQAAPAGCAAIPLRAVQVCRED